jgi:hypothetical protein
MVGDERLRALRDPRKVTNTQLARLEQRRRQHQTSRIGQRARLPRRVFRLSGCEPFIAQPLGDLQVEAEKLAAILVHTNILTLVPTLTYFLGRLHETFAGYARALTEYPVEYPTACSPQALATATPPFLLRILLGLEAREGSVEHDPILPEQIAELALRGLRGPDGTYDAFAAVVAHR